MNNLVESNNSANEIAELSFMHIDPDNLSKKKRVDSKKLPLFNQLLQFAPDAMVAKEVATNKYMQVIANGMLTKAKDGNGQLGLVLGENGISSHARLFDLDQLKKVLTTSVAMKAITMAVGQAHLAEIGTQLKEMNIKIVEIKQFLDDERISKIEAINDYFDEYFLSANHSFELSPVRRSQVEQDSREVDAVLLHLIKEIKNAITTVDNYVDDSMFGSDKSFGDLSNMLDKHLTILSQWFLVAGVKAKAIQALLLSNEYDLFRQRKNAFINQIDELNKNEIAELRETWINRINSLNAKLSSDKELAVKRNNLRSKLTVFFERINELVSYMNLTIHDIEDINGQTEIVLEVSNNRVINAYLPEPDSELMTSFKENFFKNLGKIDEEFELVPTSFSDDILAKQKLAENLKREQQTEALKVSASESLEMTKEKINDVGNKIGSVFKKIKW